MDNLFANIKGASSAKGGVYFQPGRYTVKIEACKHDQTFKGKDFFVAECRVLKSSNEAHAVGSSASFFVGNFDEWPELALGNVADFMRCAFESYCAQNNIDMEAMGYEDIDADLATEISGENQLVAGTIVDVEAYTKPTKKKTDFTHHKWTVVDKAKADSVMADYPY